MTPVRLAELHAFIVHFPIALLIASVGLDLAAVVFQRSTLVEGATWALLLGVPGVVAATISGWLSGRATGVLSPELLHLHKVTAALSTMIFVVLFLARVVWLSSRLMGWLQLAFPKSKRLARIQSALRTALPQAYSRRMPRWVASVYLMAGVAGAVLLIVTGYLGAKMVYGPGTVVPLH